tara:strand:- start:485 stop:2560 length:2076 start_codon:yes stop_codon:yes gene_type:complete
MKINRIELYNYRQFQGLHRINLESKPNKPFNVILAKNGYGKSTIYRAINWCLYGEEPRIRKSASGKDYRFRMNNTTKDKMSLYDEATVYVEIELEDEKGEKTILKRVEHHQKTVEKDQNDPSKTKVLNDKTEFLVSGIDSLAGGWKEEDDQYNFELRVNRLLPRKISAFYFFDGEALDDFIEENKTKDVKKHLEMLTKVDDAKQALANLKNWRDKLASTAAGASPELQKTVDNYAKMKVRALGEKEKLEEELRGAKLDLREKEKEFQQVRNQLKKEEKTREFIENLEAIEHEIGEHQDNINDLSKDQKTSILQNFPKIIFKSAAEKFNTLVTKEIEEGTFPPAIVENIEAISSVIEKNSLIIGDSKYADIKWKGSFSKEKFIAKINEFNDDIEKLRSSDYLLRATEGRAILETLNTFDSKEAINEIREKAKAQKNEENIIKTLKKEMAAQQKKYGKLNKGLHEQLVKKNTMLAGETKEREKIVHQLQGNIQAQETIISRSQRELSKHRNVFKKRTQNDEKLAFINDAIEVLESSIGIALFEAKRIVNSHFIDLISSSTHKQKFFSPQITDNFSIEVKDDSNNSLIDSGNTQASAGEVNVIAFSYMLAMNKGANLKFPILIDTPFGRVDEDHRIEVAKNFIKIFKNLQVTFLFQPAEFYDDKVKKPMLKHCSNFYEIVQNDGKNSIIEDKKA